MKRLLLILLVLALGLTMTTAISAQDEAMPTLRIGVLPVLNTLPLYVAQAEGFYEEQGVAVELIPFASAPDQQIAVQVGDVDGLNTDLVVLSSLVAGGFDLRAVRHEPILEPYFSIIAGAESGIETIDDLRGVAIAISENTIIEYLTTEMLLTAGFSEDEIVYEQVPAIPVRLELLNSGEVSAATLPEPLTTLATNLQGGTLIASDADSAFVPTVLAFTTEAIDANPDAITAFLVAYEQAVDAINADGESFRDVLVENIRVPEPLQAEFPIPTFPTAQAPTEEQVSLVVDWMVGRELLEEALDYDALVDASFLPEVEMDMAEGGTLVDIAMNTEGFETLVEALEIAEYVELLSGDAEFTVFAPSVEAFEGLPPGMLQGLFSSPISVQAVIGFHIVEGTYTLDDLVALDGEMLSSYFGAPLMIAVDDDGNVVLNGLATIVTADMEASNGVIHIIDGVLVPARP